MPLARREERRGDMSTESTIRDYLFENLFLVEKGLIPLEKEYHLPNSQGASGYVDILARDVLGMLVIIEIKKSNKSSREAIHEFYKYIALFKAHHGLKDYQYRCILVSTDWHELIVPFSSFSRTVAYPVFGYRLLLTEEGVPSQVIPVDFVPEGVERSLCPSHMIYLYTDKNRRTEDIKVLAEYLSQVGICDYSLLELDHPPSEVIIYRHAIYFVFDNFDLKTRDVLGRRFNIVLEEGELDLNPYMFEEVVLRNINSEAGMHYESLEIGYPEKFAGLSNKWQVSNIYRWGQLSSLVTIPDESLIDEIRGVDGNNALLFIAIARPQFRVLWHRTLERSKYTLQGNDYWSSGIYWFLAKIFNESPEATVSMYIYNPMNIIQSLFFGIRDSDPGYLPFVEIVIDRGNDAIILYGFIQWDGVTRPVSIEDVLGKVLKNPKRFVSLWTMQAVSEYDEAILKELGLSYNLVFTELQESGTSSDSVLLQENGNWQIMKDQQKLKHNIIDFIVINKFFITSLVNYLNAQIQVLAD
jgi:hypothetical protein